VLGSAVLGSAIAYSIIFHDNATSDKSGRIYPGGLCSARVSCGEVGG
jgi:hypothetical protein